MNSDNFLLTMAVIAVLVSVVGLTITYNSISTFQNLLTGRAVHTENGTVIIEIISRAEIEITHADGEPGKILDWGEGSTDSGVPAFLVTNGTVHQGDWESIDEGFRIRNTGNVVVNLSVNSNVTAGEFLGLESTDPQFKFNMSNYDADACVEWDEGFSEYEFVDFTTEPVEVCNAFNFSTGADHLRMDIMLVVPDDAAPTPKVANIILSYQSTEEA